MRRGFGIDEVPFERVAKARGPRIFEFNRGRHLRHARAVFVRARARAMDAEGRWGTWAARQHCRRHFEPLVAEGAAGAVPGEHFSQADRVLGGGVRAEARPRTWAEAARDHPRTVLGDAGGEDRRAGGGKNE